MRTSLSSDRDDIIFREMKVLIKTTFISILIDDYAYGTEMITTFFFTILFYFRFILYKIGWKIGSILS